MIPVYVVTSGFHLISNGWWILARALNFLNNYNFQQSLGTPSHFCNICQGNLSVCPLPSNSMWFILMKSSLPIYNIIYWRKGISYSNDLIRHCPEIPCQCIFMLSDLGVPRTFVMDCTSIKVVLWWKSHLSYWSHFKTWTSNLDEKKNAVYFSNISFRSRDIQVFKIC